MSRKGIQSLSCVANGYLFWGSFFQRPGPLLVLAPGADSAELPHKDNFGQLQPLRFSRHGTVYYCLSHGSSSARSLHPPGPQVQAWWVVNWPLRLGWVTPGMEWTQQDSQLPFRSFLTVRAQSLHVESGPGCSTGLAGAATWLWPVTSEYPHGHHEGSGEDPRPGLGCTCPVGLELLHPSMSGGRTAKALGGAPAKAGGICLASHPSLKVKVDRGISSFLIL